MKIDALIQLLEHVRDQHGDVEFKVQTDKHTFVPLTGVWSRVDPSTGKRRVIFSIGLGDTQIVPLTFEGEIVGKAEVSASAIGVEIQSTSITDPAMKKFLQQDPSFSTQLDDPR